MKRIGPWVLLAAVAAVAAGAYLLGTRPRETARSEGPSDGGLTGAWVFDAAAVVDALADRAGAARSARDVRGGGASEARRAAEDALAPASADPALRAAVRDLFAGTTGRLELRSDGTASLGMGVDGVDAGGAADGTWRRSGDRVTFTPRPTADAPAVGGAPPPTTFEWKDATLHLLVGGDADPARVPLRRP